ncbi:MAG: radical SAM protein [candidate division Zixibacteria bacterium RBG_16_48_11]|nr:MAG: radical SAM protein [candidate division Zixibacteria bacterium RBG_16_48_11]
MKILAWSGTEAYALIYVAELGREKIVEFVESVQPPLLRQKKWVLIISTLFGCPVGCRMCDAGSYYQGKLSPDEILAQIDFLVSQRFPNRFIPVEKFKIQFARLGEPSFNLNVLEVLAVLPDRYQAPGLLPSISTIAPAGTDSFFERLREIKYNKYPGGRFQLQFSMHTTDQKLRDKLIPVKKWGFDQIKKYGEKFYQKGDRKITLNFALAREMPIDPEILLEHFNPDKFLVKITPLNPTYQAQKNGLSSYIDVHQRGDDYPLVKELRAKGYDVILSLGEVEENFIGSNCGQFLMKHLRTERPLEDGYTYPVQKFGSPSLPFRMNPQAESLDIKHFCK